MSMNNPIFVSGCPKSGTTLVARMLNNLPEVHLDYDLALAWEFLRDYTKTINSPIVLGETRDEFNAHARDLILTGQYDRMSRDFFGRLHSGYEDGSAWGNSAKPCIFYKDTLRRWFPGADFILVLRNPLDVWASVKLANWTGQDWTNTLQGFAATYMKFFAHANDENVIVLKYEDIVADPEIVFNHLGDVPDNYLNGTGSVFLNRSHQKYVGPDGISRDDVIHNRVGRWKEELYSYEVDAIKEFLSPVFESHYYK